LPLSAHPSKRLLCLAEEPAEQTGPGRHPPDWTSHQGLEGER